MNRGIRSLENGGPVGGPIWDWLREVVKGVKEVPEVARRARRARLSERRDPIQADSLVGQPREDLYRLLDLQREGTFRPEGGQQMLMDVWSPDSPQADSLATLQQQLTGDAFAPDISIGIANVKDIGGPPSGHYIGDITPDDAPDEGIEHRKPVDPDLPVPASALAYAQLNPYNIKPDWGRKKIVLDAYHAMHGGYGEHTPEGYIRDSSEEEAYWDARKQHMARSLAHEYAHVRRPTEAHEYEAGPEYGDPQEVAEAVWQALGETQDPERYSAPTIEDAIDRAVEWYASDQGSVPEKTRESIRDEVELFLQQPIFKEHRIISGPTADLFNTIARRQHRRQPAG